MKDYITPAIAFIIGVSFVLIPYFAWQTRIAPVALGQFSYFDSLQLAPSPSNGDCLFTDGEANYWDAGCSGGGSSLDTNPLIATYFIATGTATSSLPNASTTNLSVSGSLNIFGTIGTALSDFCVAITGGSGLCDGTDATGAGGGGATTTINGVDGPSFTFATGTATGIGLNIATSSATVTFTPTVLSGYAIPLTASTTNWNTFYDTPSNRITAGTLIDWSTNTLNVDNDLANYSNATSLFLDGVTATGLEKSGTDVALSSNYIIPLSASTTNWNTFYDTPSNRITAGTGLSWTGNTINAEVQTSDLHAAVTLAGQDYLSLSTQQITANAINADNIADGDHGDFTYSSGVASVDSTLLAKNLAWTGTGTTTFAGNIDIAGNLRVQGATQLEATVTASGDLNMGGNDILNVGTTTSGCFTINGTDCLTGNVTGPSSATDNAIARFDGTTGKLIQTSLLGITDNGYIDTMGNQAWQILRPDGSEIVSFLDEGYINSTSTAAVNYLIIANAETGFSPQITSSGSDTNVDLVLSTKGSGLVKLNDTVAPSSNDGAALGSATLNFSDLFLASGGVINWNNGDVTLTHSSNLLTLAGGDFTVSGTSTLATTTLTNLLGMTSIDSTSITTIENAFDTVSASLETAIEAALDTLSNLVTVAISTTLQIPFGTACDSSSDGELCEDTTDDQLIVDSKVIPTEVPLYGFQIASTSAKFASSTAIKLPPQRLGYTVTTIICSVTSGTSKVILLFGESITCDASQEDDGTIASPTVVAASTTVPVTMGATSGSVDDVNISIFGTWTRL